MKANRILAATLATVTVLTALPSVTFAATTESSWSYSYDQATRTLTISGSGDMDDYSYYTYNQNPLYSYKNMVENIVVEGVSSIGDWSFAYFTKAKTVTIDDTVTEIGKDAFHNDTIVSVDIPDSVTKIDNDAFWYCQALKNVEIPDSVTYIGEYAFYNCTGLKDVEIPGSVKEISQWSFWAAGTNSITVNEGTTTIDADAFFYSNRLMLPTTITSINKDAFGGAGDRQQVIFGRNTYAEKYARTYGYYYFDLNATHDIADCNITGIPTDVRFINSAITFNTKVAYNYDETATLNLVKGTDYTVEYSNNDKVGTGSVTITGTGLFSGSVTKTFEIYDYVYNYTSSIPSNNYYYTGEAIEPEVTVEGLVEGTDYTVEYTNNVDEGEATVTITGTGYYRGTSTLTFYISKKSICDKIASIDELSYYYTGEAIEPEVTVEGLVEGEDYTVEYTNNVDEGIATITVTGINTYKDSTTLNFFISKRNMFDYEATIESYEYEYTGEAIEPEVTVEGLVEGEDYTVEYSDNVEPGLGFISITGINKYSGTLYITFVINEKQEEDNATPVNADPVDPEPTDNNTIPEDTTPVDPEPTADPVVEDTTPVANDTIIAPENNTEVTEENTELVSALSDIEDVDTEEADESEDEDIIVIGNNIYTIISDTEVEFSGIQNNKAKVTIPTSITYNGNKYTVTSIGDNALLGKNKVKTVVIKSSKLLSIGSKAFKGIKKTATIKVANKKLVTAYKKALSTSNGFKSTMTIKK